MSAVSVLRSPLVLLLLKISNSLPHQQHPMDDLFCCGASSVGGDVLR